MKYRMLLKFKIAGNLRFLSHHEMMAMFNRALIRAGVDLCYTQGFNPRPKLSLPLPRSVGTESDDELLCCSVICDQPDDCKWHDKIAKQLPKGCEISSISFSETKKPLQPESAIYVFPVTGDGTNERIKKSVNSLIDRLTEKEAIVMQRFSGRNRSPRPKDVSHYIDRIEYQNNSVYVTCRIDATGSIRIDEILELLEIATEQLSGPVKRQSVQWRDN